MAVIAIGLPDICNQFCPLLHTCN